MNHDPQQQARVEALKKAAELERKWQDAHAQRQRAAELFRSVQRSRGPDEAEE